MFDFIKDIFDVLRHYKKGLIIIGLVLIVILVAGGSIVKYKTTQSEFCDSCHFMAPYVRNWQESSHANVECVKCHDYGLVAVSIDALRYLTNTYESRPKANVHDENCLSSDCHSMEEISKEIIYNNNIKFHHAVHIGKELRSGKLRCTSCHNQIVQIDPEESLQHMAVNDKSCFLCHFKDAGEGEAITGCNSCHGIPEKTVMHAGFEFDHAPYLKLEVECKQCHIKIVEGTGAVPKTRCYSCHAERSPEEYKLADLHNIHVATNGIDCYKCHSDIKHSNYSMVGALDIQCENCHLRQHNKPKQLYMGIGGKSETDMPSYMFAAQVSCTGCHSHITPEGEMLAEQEKKEANRQSCVNCHGDNYDLMFDNWLSGSKKALNDFNSVIQTAKADLKNAGGNKKNRQKAQAALSKAQQNYNFILEGRMPHNIQYSLFLMNESIDDFQTAMRTINKSYRAPARGTIDKEKSCTTFCHGTAFQPEVVSYNGDELPHEMHIVDMELACSSCHSLDQHGKTEIDKSVCAGCHE